MAKKKILVVDDEDRLVEMVKIRLEVAGYQVITASDGKQGLQKAKSDKPDLILLDIMMPEIDGFEVSKQLKEAESTKKIPIIMLTALAAGHDVHREENMEKLKKAQIESYVTKPFIGGDLLDKIKAALGGQKKWGIPSY
ncbi:response regulator [Thermoproteota archaeon]